ncbi:MAG: hypothetical protein K0R69_1673 [Clostridia bacterium]|nr:hypothetical protein [Clostridia bacterium]
MSEDAKRGMNKNSCLFALSTFYTILSLLSMPFKEIFSILRIFMQTSLSLIWQNY